MAAPTFKKSKVQQTINLEEEFGFSFKGMRALREAIGEAILQRIRKRTESGTSMTFGAGGSGREGRLKSPYSKEYVGSLDFKAFGKSPGKINMTLTGDMLGLMDVKKQTGETITIGWDDEEQNAKAHGHSVGEAGGATVPRRPFFGVSKSELKNIKKKFGSEIRAAIKARNTEGGRSFNQRVAELLGIIEGEDGE